MDRWDLDNIILDVLQKEGGYVDDPDDSGGPTNHGISLRYARGIGLDLDGDGDTDDVDIKLVTMEQAAALYKQDFFLHPRIWKLPEEIQEFVFDCAVNHGPPRAIMFVQNVLHQADLAYDPITEKTVDIDGVIGPITVKAANRAQELMGDLLLRALVDHRLNFYNQLVNRNPSQDKFLRGWAIRARSFLKGGGIDA